jgi:glucose/arabinose dehydrogenase
MGGAGRKADRAGPSGEKKQIRQVIGRALQNRSSKGPFPLSAFWEPPPREVVHSRGHADERFRNSKGDPMFRAVTINCLFLTLVCLTARANAQSFERATDLSLEPVASGLSGGLYLTAPANDPRLFIVEQPGRIRIVKNGELLPTPFLDIRTLVSSGGERGLLSVAFHPDYAANGFFFVNYTNRQGDTHIARYKVSDDPDRADPASAKLLLAIDQPFPNHNGGLNLFGPDGMLYIGMGDGGSGGDPQRNGQNRLSLLGKMLRIDVNNGDPYAIPADNPFVNQDDTRPEIWALGLRNPWRFAFDRAAELLYIADVGQGEWEEVNVVSTKAAGLNYGWNIMEGPECYSRSSCDMNGLTLPAYAYDHTEGCSITGGFIYRGSRIPAIAGHYFFADYCQGWVRSFKYENSAITDRREWALDDIGRIVSFGEDSAGELYVLSEGGAVYQIVLGG